MILCYWKLFDMCSFPYYFSANHHKLRVFREISYAQTHYSSTKDDASCHSLTSVWAYVCVVVLGNYSVFLFLPFGHCVASTSDSSVYIECYSCDISETWTLQHSLTLSTHPHVCSPALKWILCSFLFGPFYSKIDRIPNCNLCEMDSSIDNRNHLFLYC